jgi:hypothetical protein
MDQEICESSGSANDVIEVWMGNIAQKGRLSVAGEQRLSECSTTNPAPLL